MIKITLEDILNNPEKYNQLLHKLNNVTIGHGYGLPIYEENGLVKLREVIMKWVLENSDEID